VKTQRWELPLDFLVELVYVPLATKGYGFDAIVVPVALVVQSDA
jgi:hypothetical protein